MNIVVKNLPPGTLQDQLYPLLLFESRVHVLVTLGQTVCTASKLAKGWSSMVKYDQVIKCLKVASTYCACSPLQSRIKNNMMLFFLSFITLRWLLRSSFLAIHRDDSVHLANHLSSNAPNWIPSGGW